MPTRLLLSVVKGLLLLALTLLANLTQTTKSSAQSDTPHFQNWADLPPGEVGRRQLERGGRLRGYFQPVEVITPFGSDVSLFTDGEFQNFESSTAKAGMLIGEVYRARVTRIPNHAGFELYPTIEIINRLFPPQGQEDRFPIPVVITQDDIDRALAGEFVLKVVYLEDPSIALPIAQLPQGQRSVDVAGSDDPLIAADKLGRPMAIIRIGARIPDEALGIGGYSPPMQPLSQHSAPLNLVPASNN